jgi:hypothetical protein
VAARLQAVLVLVPAYRDLYDRHRFFVPETLKSLLEIALVALAVVLRREQGRQALDLVEDGTGRKIRDEAHGVGLGGGAEHVVVQVEVRCSPASRPPAAPASSCRSGAAHG